MSYYGMDRLQQNWYYYKDGPYLGQRLFYFDIAGEYGYRDENNVTHYRLNCSYQFGDWIETQDTTMWRSYGGRHRAIYIVREDLMTIIRLKWL